MVRYRRPPTLPNWLAVPAVLVAVTGCALQAATPSDSLAGACQMRACECANPSGPFGTFADTTPLEWLDNGDATCPDGYRLRLISR